MANIAQIIQYEGDNSTLIWKHPCENFNSLTQLIVHESQEAIFFMNGQALDIFGPGRHTLETQNIPLIGKALNFMTKGKTPFHCEVYFINKAVCMGLKWGTDSRVHFIDPMTGLPLDIGASGEINLQVADSKKLLLKLVGTGTGLTTNEVLDTAAKKSILSSIGKAAERSLQTYFRAPLMTTIKSYLANVIRDQKINILEAEAHLDVISAALKKLLLPVFEEYGLTIPQFYITTLALPEDDRNFQDMKALLSQAYLGVKTEEVQTSIAEATQRRKLVEAQTEAQLRILQAQSEAEITKAHGLAEAEIMRAKGYTERDVIAADVQKTYAESLGNFGSNVSVSGVGGGSAGVAGDMVGMMAGLKVAETMLSKMDTALSGMSATPAADGWNCSCGATGNTNKFCVNCGNPRPGAAFCPQCGSHVTAGAKFCPECGAAMQLTCAKCGTSLAPGAKFCSGCGEKL